MAGRRISFSAFTGLLALTTRIQLVERVYASRQVLIGCRGDQQIDQEIFGSENELSTHPASGCSLGKLPFPVLSTSWVEHVVEGFEFKVKVRASFALH